MKFKVWDKIELVDTDCMSTYKGSEAIVTGFDHSQGYVIIEWIKGCYNGEQSDGSYEEERFKKLGGSMYQDLKDRIEALDDGWNKDCDDLLKDINPPKYSIQVYSDRIDVYCGYDLQTMHTANFLYSTQCKKMSALKEALLWLLDHSDIAKVDKKRETQIEKLLEEVGLLKDKWTTLEEKIEELRG